MNRDSPSQKFEVQDADLPEKSPPNETILQQLESVLQGLTNVPAFSQAIEKLQEVIDQPDATIEMVAEAVKLDAGLTTKYLHVASSAVFAGEAIATVEEALFRIGMNEARGLGLSMSVFDRFSHLGVKLDQKLFWLHSLLTARITECLFRACRGNPGGAYLASLLRDTGRLILDHHFSLQYEAAVQSVKEQKGTLHEAEEQLFGINHIEVAAMLCEKWRLDQEIIDSIRSSSQISAMVAQGEISLTEKDLLAVCLNVADSLAVICSKSDFQAELDLEDFQFESVPEWKLYEQFPRKNRLRLDLAKEVQKAHSIFDVIIPKLTDTSVIRTVGR